MTLELESPPTGIPPGGRRELHQMIAEYVADCRCRGAMIPYEDHAVIARWLDLAPSEESLMLVLADELPRFFSNRRRRALRYLTPRIVARLRR